MPCTQHQLTDGSAPRLADKARRERGGEGSSEESRSKTQVAETRGNKQTVSILRAAGGKSNSELLGAETQALLSKRAMHEEF